jgi:hypothetical protein
LNSCWRSKNRTGLVANLQRESRQILALEEENRQLRCALREMEGGLHLVMTEYRRLASEFSHSDLNNFAISRILNAEQVFVFYFYDPMRSVLLILFV